MNCAVRPISLQETTTYSNGLFYCQTNLLQNNIKMNSLSSLLNTKTKICMVDIDELTNVRNDYDLSLSRKFVNKIHNCFQVYFYDFNVISL